MEFVKHLLSPDFMPHGYCYLWNPWIVWLHVVSDALITLSYYCIPMVLVYFIRKNRDLPFNRFVWMFGAFILACGTTHLLEVWNIWHSSYLLAGVAKAITAVVSVVTALMLVPLVPQVISLPSRMHLLEMNRKLERELAEREQIETTIDAPLRRRATVGFVVAILLTSLLGVLSWHNARQAAQDADWVAHSHEVLTTLETTLRHLVDVETGGRGFALSGLDPFLGPYETGRRTVGEDLDRLGRLTADNADQQRRLEVLREQVQAKIESSEEVVSVRRNTGTSPTEPQLERGRKIMDAARITVEEMEAGERQLLEVRTQRARATRRLTILVTTLGATLGVVFLAIAGHSVSRQINVSATARAQVIAINADLERRVAQRTAALNESESRLAGVIQSAMDSIITVDEEQRILLFNAAAERMFRCPAAEALGQPIARFIPQRFHAAHGRHIKRFGEAGVTTRAMGALGALWGVRADGEEFQIEASISQIEASGRKLFTVILRDITERRIAEEARERLAAIVESSDDAIISKTLDGTITAWNRGAEKVFGYSSSEVVGKPMLKLFPQERVNEESEILARIRRGESVEHFETVRIRKDGKKIDVSITISPIRDSNGTVVGASKIARDITEHKRAEEALREQAQVLDSAQVFVRDIESRVVFWPRGAEKLYGFTSQEALGILSHDLFHTRFPEPLEMIEKKLFETGLWEGELIHTRRDRSVIAVSSAWVLHRDSRGRPTRILETNIDISERKRAEEQLAAQSRELTRSQQSLQAQTALLQSVLDSMGEGLVAADEHGEFTLWNPAAQKILGLGAAKIPGREWSQYYGIFLPDTLTPFASEQLPLARAIRGETCTVEMYARNAELVEGVWIEANAHPLKGADGVHRGGVVAFRDITQKKTAEREIHKLNEDLELRVAERTAQLEEANKELESFTYTVAHDLRAPLRHIAGFSGILVEESNSSLDAQAHRYLQRIQEGTRKMGQLVDELLTLARVGRQTPNLQVTGLSSIVREVINLLQPEIEGREIEWKIADLPFVECDPTLVKQVFQNLVSNALKYSRPRPVAVIEIGQTQDHGCTTIFVRDNGVGFSMKYADKLFGVFQRLHRNEDFEGTGVGLATVQRIVKKHQGRVWAEAELDKGATFYFTLGGLPAPEVKKESMAMGA